MQGAARQPRGNAFSSPAESWTSCLSERGGPHSSSVVMDAGPLEEIVEVESPLCRVEGSSSRRDCSGGSLFMVLIARGRKSGDEEGSASSDATHLSLRERALAPMDSDGCLWMPM